MCRLPVVYPLTLVLTLGVLACGGDVPSQASQDSHQDPASGGRKIDDEAADAIVRKQEAAVLAVRGAPDMAQTYQHSTGFFFRYPSDWRAQEGQEGVALTPPDPFRIDGEPAEAFFVIGDTADGIVRPEDPKVGAYLDQLFGQGFLKSTGQPERRKYPRHEGAIYSWEGTSPEGQGDFKASAWITILEGYAIGAFALTPKDRFEARARVIEDIFSTFGFERPKSDPRLFGYWRYTDTYTSGTFTFASDTHLRLFPDGTCMRSSQSLGGLQSMDDAGSAIGNVNVDGGESGATKGRWSTAEKVITLNWSSGAEEWDYLISGNDMMWRSGGAKRMWDRVQ